MKSWVKIVSGVIIVLGGYALYQLTGLAPAFTWDALVGMVEALRTNPWAWLEFLIAYTLSSVIWPVVLFPIAGGVVFGFWKGLLLNTLAANLGAWVTFGIARGFGRDVVRRLIRGSLERFDAAVSRQGFLAVFLIRFVGFPPYVVVNYWAGLTGVRVRDYVWGSFLGMLPWTIVLTYFAQTLWDLATTAGRQGLLQALGRYGLPLLAAGLAFAVVLTVTIIVKRKNAAQ